MSDLPSTSYNPRALATTLAWLRVCAVAGQFATVLAVAHLLTLPISETRLLAGIAVLTAFNVFVGWRLTQPWPVGETEVVAHLAVDTGVLCYLLYLTGGASNPFVSLYIVPIALAAMTLSPRPLAASVLIASLAYLIVLFWHEPLPHLANRVMPDTASAAAQTLDLRAFGTAIDFAISAGLLGFFIWRLARDLRERETAAQRERERALRDEGILAIATQAAGAAHELNTPLSTICTLLGELRREHPASTPLGEDLALLAGQADRCRDILREIVQIGSAQLTGQARLQTLPEFAADCAERFRLLRPAVDLKISLDCDDPAPPLRIVPALRHAILNLLNNAADASELEASAEVEFAVAATAADIVFEVRDHGSGLPEAVRGAGGARFVTGKRDGLGLGLALTNATAERFHGTLHADASPHGGTITRLRLPLAALSDQKQGAG